MSEPAERLLYECIRELSYVQDPGKEVCTSGICATPLGAELIERGMKLLNVSKLTEEDLDAERLYEHEELFGKRQA